VRAAVRAVHDLISESAKRYAGSSCETSDHDDPSEFLSVVLSNAQIVSFAASIPETSLPHSTLWPVPRWCSGEYNTPPLPIACFCWTCPRHIVADAYCRPSDGTASAPVTI